MWSSALLDVEVITAICACVYVWCVGVRVSDLKCTYVYSVVIG